MTSVNVPEVDRWLGEVEEHGELALPAAYSSYVLETVGNKPK